MKSWARLILSCAVVSAGCKSAPPAPPLDPIPILLENEAAMLALKSHQAEAVTIVRLDERPADRPPDRYELSTLIAEKPNLLRYESWRDAVISSNGELRSSGFPTMALDCDGTTLYEQFGDRYQKPSYRGAEDLSAHDDAMRGFFDKHDSIKGTAFSAQDSGDTVEFAYGGTDTVDGALCDKILIHRIFRELQPPVDFRKVYFIARSDHLLRRLESRIEVPGKSSSVHTTMLRNVKLNAEIDHSKFVYTPPAGVTFESEAEIRKRLHIR